MFLHTGGGGSSGGPTDLSGVFGSTNTTFPSWDNPDPSAYSWTLPDTSHWWNFGQNVSQDVLSFIANTLLELIAWILHLAILVASKFSDPTWITDPVTAKVATVFKNGYEDVFMKFLPVLVMITVGYLAWKYVVAHHAKMLTGIISTVLASGLIAFFFFDFGQAFKWLDGAGNLVTETAASAVSSAAGTPVSSEYDTLWNNYIVYPWEYGQFGQFSAKQSDFNVNPAFCSAGLNATTAPGWCVYTPDPTTSNPNPSDNSAVISPSDNWVQLYLKNTSSNARKTLEQDLQDAVNQKTSASPFVGTNLTVGALSNANPYPMIPFLFIELLLMITPVIFLVYVGFQLFVRELLFIVTIMMGLVTVPMAFVPEIGWRITFNWIREAVGHQVERVSNAVYAAILFAVAGIVTTSIGGGEMGMMLAFLIDAILFAAAIMYRQKVFSVAVHPLSDAARGVDSHQRMTMDEWAQHQHEREQHERHRVGTDGKHHGKLAQHFAVSELEHSEHHLPALHGRRGGDVTVARGSDEQPQFMVPEHEHKSVSGKTGHLASSFNADASKTSKLAHAASELGQAARGKIREHISDVSHPGRPLTQEERIRGREQRARSLEQQLHSAAVGGLAATLRQVAAKRLSDSFNPPDAPPSAPPTDGAGPADNAGDDKDLRRATMITEDGRMSQSVVLDQDGKEIAVEPPVIHRDRDDDDSGGGGQPVLADGFSVPMQDSVSGPGSARLYAERLASPKGENGTLIEPLESTHVPSIPQNNIVVQPDIPNVSTGQSGGNPATSRRSSHPVRRTPDNVTRVDSARASRPQGKGRKRQQRSQTQGRRKVVNDRSATYASTTEGL